MISIGTFEELQRQNHTLALYCICCNRWGMANLDWLINIGDKPMTEARFKDCGEIVEKQVRPLCRQWVGLWLMSERPEAGIRVISGSRAAPECGRSSCQKLLEIRAR